MGLSSARMMRMSRLLDEAIELEEAGRRAWLAALGAEHQDIAEALAAALGFGSDGTEDALSTLPKVGADGERIGISNARAVQGADRNFKRPCGPRRG